MNLQQSLQNAVRNLLVNKVRFCQALLGMVIGVAGVVFVLAISSSLFNVSSLSNKTYADGLINARMNNNAELARKITADDFERAVADNPDVLQASTPYYVLDLPGGLSYEGRSDNEAYVMGVDEDYYDMMLSLQLQEGRFLEPMDIAREQRNCVIGSRIAQELLGGDALGKTVKIWGENYTVVGVMQDVVNDIDGDNGSVWIPYPIAKKLKGNVIRTNGRPYNYYQEQYFIWAKSPELMYEAHKVIEKMCEEVSGHEEGEAWLLFSDSFSFISSLMDSSIKAMVLQYLALAGFVILIGGVGIMNVMIASVSARTKEIGIRKAFGASSEDIRRQFMLEAVITSLLGGLLGLLLGLGSVAAVGLGKPNLPISGGVYYPVDLQYMNWLSLGLPILLALAISIGVGVIFGTYPAQQAAKMEPVAAINSD